MTRYKVHVPCTIQMGSYTTIATEYTMESKEDNALWDYNNARAHDGLKPLNALPDGTTFTRIEDN